MSRIRSIHPGLWTDEAFMSLSAHARLLYIGLWTEAFDDGVFEWKPLTLKAKLFPVDTVDVPDLLIELVNAGVIARMDREPKQPGVIRNFQKFQRPKKPNSSGMLPDRWREYVGASTTDATSEDGSSPPVPHQFPTSSEKSPQMEDGGGSKEEQLVAQRTEPASAALPRDWLDQLLVANGMNAGFREERHVGLMNPAPLLGLLEAGFDWRRDLIAGIASKPYPKARTWGYFEGQIRDFAAKRDGIAARPAPADHGAKLASWPIERWRVVLEQFHQTGEWQRQTYGPRPGEPGCMVPAELLSRAAA